jgi:hypothetical protein
VLWGGELVSFRNTRSSLLLELPIHQPSRVAVAMAPALVRKKLKRKVKLKSGDQCLGGHLSEAVQPSSVFTSTVVMS